MHPLVINTLADELQQAGTRERQMSQHPRAHDLSVPLPQKNLTNQNKQYFNAIFFILTAELFNISLHFVPRQVPHSILNLTLALFIGKKYKTRIICC